MFIYIYVYTSMYVCGEVRPGLYSMHIKLSLAFRVPQSKTFNFRPARQQSFGHMRITVKEMLGMRWHDFKIPWV